MNYFYLGPHPCQLDEATLLSQCRVEFTRRGGPGGQHRNKVESAVVLIHGPTQILAEANERRDQSQNRRVALGRLRRQLSWLVRSLPPAPPTKTRGQTPQTGGNPETVGPSPLWRARCIDRPADVSPEHWDYPALVAEALDHVIASEWEFSTAAPPLGVSTARLAKLFRADRQTLEWINRQRKLLGFPLIR
ncbi:MAG: peptide chain release factor-like protein [Pirellulaceae bacterium]|nr:peptide chain release factor-like protein [Pirellulaceae bacterium]